MWKPTQIVDGKEFVITVTVRDLVEALVVIVLTSIATRNLPGLLEVGILRRFHVDAATRYAMTSVTRYLIVFTGVILGLSMLGLRWANLQWLAAGFSVGLGFGMQEIFANFISGLIVLFERPFRIGDIVSIGGVEGVVARIRTRATTIIDWDNKEVVVPNKSFITDRLVNWTLSDATTRLVIKLGIAYRNDPRAGAEDSARGRQVASAGARRSGADLPDDRLRRQHAEFRAARLCRPKSRIAATCRTNCSSASSRCAGKTTSNSPSRSATCGSATPRNCGPTTPRKISRRASRRSVIRSGPDRHP